MGKFISINEKTICFKVLTSFGFVTKKREMVSSVMNFVAMIKLTLFSSTTCLLQRNTRTKVYHHSMLVSLSDGPT